MPEFQVIFTRTTVETQELTIKAKTQEDAEERAQAKIDDEKLKEKAWEIDEQTIEYEVS